MIHYIYKIVNTINGKIYIGYTNQRKPESRWKKHLSDLNTLDRPLYRAMRKYGVENFTFDVIYCSLNGEHTLSQMESHFIKEYKSHISTNMGYNIATGGQSNLGWVPSDATRAKWRESKKNRIITDSTKQKTSESLKKFHENNPQAREHQRTLAIERGYLPPRSTKESQEKSAKTRTGQKHHSESRKKQLSDELKNPHHPIHSIENKEKRSTTWKMTGRNRGATNTNAVFAKVYTPTNELVSEGFLREICDSKGYPFAKFLAASRHGNTLIRGQWKGWRIERI